MSDAKHTPKSWHGYKDGTQWVISNGTHLIATTAGSPAHLGPGHANRDKANAHLIAAVPELLEALEACLDYGSMTGAEWVKEKARAAIAKARGEQQ